MCEKGRLQYVALVPKNVAPNKQYIGPAHFGIGCNSCGHKVSDVDLGLMLPWYIERMTEINKILQQVHDMRQAQKDYFQQRSDRRLRIAFAKEQIVDNLLALFVKEGSIVAVSKPGTNLSTLFNFEE